MHYQACTINSFCSYTMHIYVAGHQKLILKVSCPQALHIQICNGTRECWYGDRSHYPHSQWIEGDSHKKTNGGSCCSGQACLGWGFSLRACVLIFVEWRHVRESHMCVLQSRIKSTFLQCVLHKHTQPGMQSEQSVCHAIHCQKYRIQTCYRHCLFRWYDPSSDC